MKLTGASTAFELRIVGYEFPEIIGEKYDSNWLLIEGHVTHAAGSWVFCHPCMLTFDVVELADWLEQCAKNKLSDMVLHFLEPNIWFSLVNCNTLRVCFDAEALPSWIPLEYTSEQDFYCDFPVNEIILIEAARQLRDQLARFPQHFYEVY